MRHILSDARFAIRLLLRAPTFAITLLAVLALGIGATTSTFSIVETLLFKPLPYPHAEQLTVVWKAHDVHARDWPTSIPDFQDWRSQNTTFSAMAGTSFEAVSMKSEGRAAEFVSGAGTTGDFFTVFGITPARGRFFGPDDDRVDAPPVCVISADLWRDKLGSDPNVVGRALVMNGKPFVVVGLAPSGFHFGGPHGDHADAWIPLAHTDQYPQWSKSRGNNFMNVVARRKPGVTIEQAQADMTRIAKDIQQRFPDTNSKRSANVVDLQEGLVGSAKPTMIVLFGAVGLVFLVVCANVASLLLARGATRRGEMAARAALGATRSRLVTQLVTESVVVFVIGGALGAIASFWMVDFFGRLVEDEIWSASVVVKPDLWALAFTVVVSLLFGIGFGLAPALATSRVAPHEVLKESAAQAGTSRRQRIVRSGLVVAQVALAFALLVGAGLSLRGFAKTAATPPGFDTENLVAARLMLPESKYDDDQSQIAFYDALLTRLAAKPGVESVGGNTSLPMMGSNSNGWFAIEGRKKWAPGEGPIIERNVVTAGYFQTLRIPILRGRDFGPGDRMGGKRVVIINQAAAEHFFPGEDPVGRRIDLEDHDDGEQWSEIVGVVGDVRKRGLTVAVPYEAYVPIAQHGRRWMSIAVRSSQPEAQLAQLSTTVQEIDPELSLFSKRRMKDRMAGSVERQRFLTLVLGAFAAMALVLSTLGLFGLVSYQTSQRTRELGIRMALGGSPRSIVALVVGGGIRLAGLGLAVGLVGAVFVGRALAARLAGVPGFDPLVYAAIPAVLAVVAVLACLVPALRAVRIPPSVALRYE